MSLGTRLMTGLLVVMLLVAAPGVYLLGLVERLEREQAEVGGIGLAEAGGRERVRRELAALDEFTRKYYVLRDAAYAAELERLRGEVAGDVEALAATAGRDPEVAAHTAALAAVWRRYVETAAGRPPSERPLLRALAEVGEALDALDGAARSALAAQVAAAQASTDRARTLASLAGAAALLTALAVAAALTRAVAGPIRELARGARAVGDADYGFQVPETGAPELAALARDFNRMAERLRELDGLKRDLVSNVSHDLKAPLASMQETTRLLLEGGVGELAPAQEKLLRLNLECGERLSAMISELLDMARLEAGAVDYDLAPRDLAEVAGAVADEAAGLLERRGQRLRRNLPPGVLARADRTLITQAIWNLLANGVRFTPEGGELGLRLQRFTAAAELVREYPRAPAAPLPAATLEVWDSGPGVADEDKERIFERFQRGGSAAGGGTGLGLAIARRIALDHGGALWVEDRAGGGSRFVLLLASGAEPERSAEAAA